MRVIACRKRESSLPNSVRLHIAPTSAFISCLCSAILIFNVRAGNVSAQNKVLKLDGNASYVELPPNIFKDLTQATVEAWVRFERLRNYSRIFEFGAGWQSMSLFNHGNTSDLRFNLYPQFAKTNVELQYIVRAPGLLRTNEWIHLAAVSGSRGMKLYANGVLVGQHTNGASFADIKAFQTNYLGRGLVRNPTDQDFRGQIDEVRVWNHRRNTAQIRENMFKRLTGNETGLMHLWNFDDSTASDSASSAHGKLMGNAKIVDADIAPSTEVAASQPSPPASPTTNVPPVSAAINVAPSNTGLAAWMIAGALCLIVVLLGWLAVMLRRSGVGSAKLLASPSMPPLAPSATISPPNVGPSSAPQELKERALAELTDFAKQSLVQGLYSQRTALLEAHQKAQQELAELEARVVALHLPDRIQAYEKRIAELEKELETRSDELHELTQATLQVLRQKLEEEKQKEQKEQKAGRFN